MNPANAALLAQAVERLRQGGLVAIPTETVYGLAADALNPQAVARIFAAKGRPADHPLIIHLPPSAPLEQWAKAVPPEALQLANAFWPGPLTLILKKHPRVPLAVTGGQDTVGLRVPNHPLALALLEAFGSGLAAPSANRFGRISPTCAAHVAEELGPDVALILDGGACERGIESTIIDLSRLDTVGPVLLRPGAITQAALEAVLGRSVGVPPGAAPSEAHAPNAALPRVSGSLKAHYAPQTPLVLLPCDGFETALRTPLTNRPMARFGVLARHPCPASFSPAPLIWVTAPALPDAFAHALYAALRDLDKKGLDLVYVQAPPDHADWAGVRDRLERAACGSGAATVCTEPV
jgi:L-threonylcarbamoyladenylate synthase